MHYFCTFDLSNAFGLKSVLPACSPTDSDAVNVYAVVNVTEAEGYLFSEHWHPGIVYTTITPQYTRTDEIAFGFMTDQPNGTIIRLDSGVVDFIEARLVSFRPGFFFPPAPPKCWDAPTPSPYCFIQSDLILCA